MRLKLTQTRVDKLRAPTASRKQEAVWDSELTGFGIILSGVTTSANYCVQRDVAGKTRRVTIAATNVLTLDKARDRAKDLLADLYRGIDPKAASRTKVPTLKEAMEDYLKSRKDLKPRSRDGYRAFIEGYLPDWLEKPLTDIDGDMVVDRHEHIATTIATDRRRQLTAVMEQEVAASLKAGLHNSRGMSEAALRKSIEATYTDRFARLPKGEATANDTMRTLGIIWNFIAEKYELPPNPVRRLRRSWYHVPRRERIIRFEDLPRFYTAMMALPNPIARDYLLLLLFTGMRREEAASLRWEHIDLVEKIIRIPIANNKGARVFNLPMNSVVHRMFVARRAVGDTAPWVFPSETSESGHIVEPASPLSQIAVATGIVVSAHDLRRTFISIAETASIPGIAVKRLVNHSTGDDVTAGYIQFSLNQLREAAQTVAQKILALCGVKERGEKETGAADKVEKIPA